MLQYLDFSPYDLDETTAQTEPKELRVRRYLEKLLYTSESVNDWIEGRGSNYINETYDGLLGWVPAPGRYKHGVDGSVSHYGYDASGARRMIQHRNEPCRINTYGNSFTHCDQVNDGETWQEILAAHLGEPVRNYGVSGHSVYQMYVRMKREEIDTPAPYLIVNIYNDDHHRSLFGWGSLRLMTRDPDVIREGIQRPTMPYVEVNPAAGTLAEHENPCPTAESLLQLCEGHWVHERFKDHFPVKIILARAGMYNQGPETSHVELTDIVREYGLTPPAGDDLEGLAGKLEALYMEAALFASMRIVNKMEAFAAAHRKQILYVLSHTEKHLAGALHDGSRTDQPFVDFLNKRGLPYVDLMDVHREDFSHTNLGVPEYIRRYYVAHYNPLGNHFTAFAVKDKLVELMDPRPATYV